MAKQSKTQAVQTEPETIERAMGVPGGTNPIAEKYVLVELYEQYKTKSAVIRFLHSQGYKVGEIAKFMGIIYQHARNVIKQPQKKSAQVAAPSTEPVAQTE